MDNNYVSHHKQVITFCLIKNIRWLKKEVLIELDLRSLPPFERHEKIFQMWNALSPGETLRITNDHDPAPLHYQFEAEYKNQYQ